jgi:hypothetical protein
VGKVARTTDRPQRHRRKSLVAAEIVENRRGLHEQALQNGPLCGGDTALLAMPDGTPGPIHQLDAIAQRERNAGGLLGLLENAQTRFPSECRCRE